MNNSEGLKSFQQSLAGLPQWVSERILQQINQLTHYEPVIGIMGKSGAGKSSLCNALFASEVSPVSDVAACTREPLRFRLQVGDRYMTLMDLPGVGESGTRDTEYAALYREQLSRLDLVLWLIKADAGVFFYQEPENVPIRVTATGAFHPETSASGHYHVQQYHPRRRPRQSLPPCGS